MSAMTRLAGDFAGQRESREKRRAWHRSAGVREQAMLTQTIRSELKTQGVLGHPEDHDRPVTGLAGQPEPLSAGYVPTGDGDG